MSIFKQLGSQDIVSTKTLLHEAIPLTGTILSGAYGLRGNERNIKNFGHEMFQSVYDYPFLSSSANHVMDISIGYHSTNSMSMSTGPQNSKKINIYNQMAQVLMGYDKDGNIQQFDKDGDLTGGTKINSCYFLTFSRLLVKDEIKKGSFSMLLNVGGGSGGASSVGSSAGHTDSASDIRIQDVGAATNYRVNSPAGEYGILYAEEATNSVALLADDDATNGSNATTVPVGLIYYQAGVVVLTSSVFLRQSSSFGGGNPVGNGSGILNNSTYAAATQPAVHFSSNGFVGNEAGAAATVYHAFKSGSITGSCDALRDRISNIQFNNTIELNSTIHFCRLNHNEFNYSSNPTYLSGSQLRVKQNIDSNPVSYITGIGLYSADNQLLAVGKLSEPIRKDPTIELTFRARLDY
jgi:hypothetical protein